MDEFSDEESDLLAELLFVERDVQKIIATLKTLRSAMLLSYCEGFEGWQDLSPLLAALDSPQCDRATGLLIYWLSDPTQFAGKVAVPEHEAQNFALYKKAEEKLLANAFPLRKIKFAPLSDMWYPASYWQSVRRNTHIPKKLKPKIPEDGLVSEWIRFKNLPTVPGEKCRNRSCNECRIDNGVFCRTHHFEMIFGQPPPHLPREETEPS